MMRVRHRRPSEIKHIQITIGNLEEKELHLHLVIVKSQWSSNLASGLVVNCEIYSALLWKQIYINFPILL